MESDHNHSRRKGPKEFSERRREAKHWKNIDKNDLKNDSNKQWTNKWVLTIKNSGRIMIWWVTAEREIFRGWRPNFCYYWEFSVQLYFGYKHGKMCWYPKFVASFHIFPYWIYLLNANLMTSQIPCNKQTSSTACSRLDCLFASKPVFS